TVSDDDDVALGSRERCRDREGEKCDRGEERHAHGVVLRLSSILRGRYAGMDASKTQRNGAHGSHAILGGGLESVKSRIRGRWDRLRQLAGDSLTVAQVLAI